MYVRHPGVCQWDLQQKAHCATYIQMAQSVAA